MYVNKTKDERISNTVKFKHQYITQPNLTPVDVAIKAIRDLTGALKLEAGKDENEFKALQKLENIVANRLTESKGTKQKPQPQDPNTNPPHNLYRSPRVQMPQRDAPAYNTRSSKSVATDLDMAMCIVDSDCKKLNEGKTCEFANAEVAHPETGLPMTHRQVITHPETKVAWHRSSANKFGRLAQGIGGRIKGTDTIHFIQKEHVPRDRLKDVTYGKFVCEEKPHKTEVQLTRLTMGGDKVNYPYEVRTPTAEMLLVKTHLNSIVPTPNAQYMTIDISNFYLNMPMVHLEYFKIKLSDIPDEVIDKYNLRDIAMPDRYVYIEVTKGMYGLPQAGLLANKLLEQRLNVHGYTQSKIIPGLWKHKDNDITFTLVVDNFGVKYVRKADAKHLSNVLKKNYQTTEDSPSTGITRTERCTLLYYARIVDPTIFTALSAIAAQQASPTQTTMNRVRQ